MCFDGKGKTPILTNYPSINYPFWWFRCTACNIVWVRSTGNSGVQDSHRYSPEDSQKFPEVLGDLCKNKTSFPQISIETGARTPYSLKYYLIDAVSIITIATSACLRREQCYNNDYYHTIIIIIIMIVIITTMFYCQYHHYLFADSAISA